jgi:exodeoxyribonuclease VII small subunit
MTVDDVDRGLDGIKIVSPADVPDGTRFEEAMAALEECVDALESDDPGLDDAVRLFRRGTALREWCEARLDAIRAQVEEIAGDPADEA